MNTRTTLLMTLNLLTFSLKNQSMELLVHYIVFNLRVNEIKNNQLLSIIQEYD